MHVYINFMVTSILQHASVNSYPHSQLQLEVSAISQMNVSVTLAGLEVCVMSVYLLLAVVSI